MDSHRYMPDRQKQRNIYLQTVRNSMDFDDEMVSRYNIDRAYADHDRGLSIDDPENRSYLLDDIDAETELTEAMR
jgi:hypothetical protein